MFVKPINEGPEGNTKRVNDMIIRSGRVEAGWRALQQVYAAPNCMKVAQWIDNRHQAPAPAAVIYRAAAEHMLAAQGHTALRRQQLHRRKHRVRKAAWSAVLAVPQCLQS